MACGLHFSQHGKTIQSVEILSSVWPTAGLTHSASHSLDYGQISCNNVSVLPENVLLEGKRILQLMMYWNLENVVLQKYILMALESYVYLCSYLLPSCPDMKQIVTVLAWY